MNLSLESFREIKENCIDVISNIQSLECFENDRKCMAIDHINLFLRECEESCSNSRPISSQYFDLLKNASEYEKSLGKNTSYAWSLQFKLAKLKKN